MGGVSDLEVVLEEEGRRAGTQPSRGPSLPLHPPHVHPESLSATVWHSTVTRVPQARGYTWERRGKKPTPPLTGQREAGGNGEGGEWFQDDINKTLRSATPLRGSKRKFQEEATESVCLPTGW